MDWFTLVTLGLAAWVTVVVCRRISEWRGPQEPAPVDPESAEALFAVQDDINKGASWENMGL